MSPPPTVYTPPSELDGTVAGMIITAVVAALALGMLIGLVYWANSHPTARKPEGLRPGSAHRHARASGPRSAVPGAAKSATAPPQAPAAASPAEARDPELAAFRRADGPQHG